MGVPDKTYFGEKPEGGGILYGEVRKIDEEQRKLEILKKRLDVLLIDQINNIAKRNEDNNPFTFSPFPLCVLTLLSIETLGRIFSDIEKIENENDYEQSKIIVTPVYGLMDSKLLHKPTKDFYKGFEKIHGTMDKKSISRYSDVIHKYQRNTFNHGYQAKGVFLEHTISEFWILNEVEGYMVINPYLFWDRYVEVYEKVFTKILNAKEKQWRSNALKYFEKLIS